MLIKVITSEGDTHIIENITDVTVKSGLRGYDPNVPVEFGPVQDFFFDHADTAPGIKSAGDKPSHLYAVREINFARGGACRLFVGNMAYVCNDEGRTIEKVIAIPQTVNL